MKKVLAIALMMLCSFSLLACGNDDETNVRPPTDTTTSTNEDDTNATVPIDTATSADTGSDSSGYKNTEWKCLICS